MISRIYDKLLYRYLYAENWLFYQIDRMVDYRKNVRWIKQNGPV